MNGGYSRFAPLIYHHNVTLRLDGRCMVLLDAARGRHLDAGYGGNRQEVTMNGLLGFMMKRPTHPGEFIKHEIIAPYGLSVTAAARVLGVTRATLSTLLNAL
jgi:hypothetical protein